MYENIKEYVLRTGEEPKYHNKDVLLDVNKYMEDKDMFTDEFIMFIRKYGDRDYTAIYNGNNLYSLKEWQEHDKRKMFLFHEEYIKYNYK